MPLDQKIQHDDLELRGKIDRICEYLRVQTGEVKDPEDFANARHEELDDIIAGFDPPSRPQYWDPDRDDAAKPDKSAKKAHRNGKGKRQAVRLGEGRWMAMPIDLLADVFARKLKNTDITVLALVFHLCGEKGYCWHGAASLAKLMNVLTFKTPAASLDRLNATGWVELLSPEQSKSVGYDTEGAPCETIRLLFEMRDGKIIRHNRHFPR